MRLIYSLLFYLLLPVIFLRLGFRSLKAPAYRHRVAERFGFIDLSLDNCIWVHAVSVGETLAAVPIIERLLAQYPEDNILVTTMTPTGSERVRAVFGERVYHVYAPYDLPDAVLRFIRRVNPRVLIVMETELWPNIVHYSAASGCPVIVANARLSAKSAAGYHRFASLTRGLLSELTLIAAQAEPDARRFQELGLQSDQLAITGSIKFDLKIDETLKHRADALRAAWGEQRPVWIAASTHQGEDEQVLAAFKAMKEAVPDLLLVLVPRHPERFELVGQMIKQAGWMMSRRSSDDAVNSDTNVILGDTMGELLLLYGASDLAFVGGSLVATGGHNVLEPLAFGVPVIVGPNMFNFQVIVEMLLEANAIIQVPDSEGLASQGRELLLDQTRRQALGQRGLAVLEQNRGALDRLMAAISKIANSKVVNSR